MNSDYLLAYNHYWGTYFSALSQDALIFVRGASDSAGQIHSIPKELDAIIIQ